MQIKQQNLNRDHAEFAILSVDLSRTRQRQSLLCKRRLQVTPQNYRASVRRKWVLTITQESLIN